MIDTTTEFLEEERGTFAVEITWELAACAATGEAGNQRVTHYWTEAHPTWATITDKDGMCEYEYEIASGDYRGCPAWIGRMIDEAIESTEWSYNN